MPKKKQVTFQTSIPGKFIPRNSPPPGSIFRSGLHDNRFNAKMAELLASSSSSSTVNTENELVSNKSSQDDALISPPITFSPPSEITFIDSSHVHSKLFRRRIVTMLETLSKTNDDTSSSLITYSSSSASSSPHTYKHQPITFGQLRQATISSTSEILTEEKSNSSQITNNIEENAHKHLTTFTKLHSSNSTSITLKSSTKEQTNNERLYYSPSLEQLFQEQNLISQTKKDLEEHEEEQQQTQKSPLTVDQILAMYYSKANPTTNTESHLPSTISSSPTTSFYIYPSDSRWNSIQNNQHNIPSSPRSVANEQNRNRPPPPPYSSTAISDYRVISTDSNSTQHLTHSPTSTSIYKHLHPNLSTSQSSLPKTLSMTVLNSSLPFVPNITNPINSNSIRLPPPPYKSPTTTTTTTTMLSSIKDSSSSSQQLKTNNNNLSTGFDREFSRLLYGKDTSRTRRQKQKRKAFSDPVKKSVEEALRSIERSSRRNANHSNKAGAVKEENDDETETETETESINIHKQDINFLSRHRFQRQTDLNEKTRESARKAFIPANPILKRRIPSFLRVYSQASSSNDALLQWHLFTLPELESFVTMMTRLYKNENLARVQLYEIYRAALYSALASKKVTNIN